jgi:hypothetical protein
MSATNTGWRLMILDAAQVNLTLETSPILMELVSPGPQGASAAGGGAVTSVNGATGAVVLGAADVGAAAAAHGHAIADVSGLSAALAGKASSAHGHAIADVSGLQTALDGKAASSHTHPVSDLQSIPNARLLGNSVGAAASPSAIAVSSPLAFNGVSGNLEFNAPGTNGLVYFRASGALTTSAKFAWNDATATLTIADLAGDQIAISPTAFAGTLYSVSGVNTGDQFTSLPADVVLGRTTGTGAAQQITCTAAGRAILDDASASAQRTTLGLGTTDSPQFAKVILQNGEFIENTIDGDVHIMPAPGNSSFVGIRFQFNWSNDTVRIGTKRSSTGTPDDGRIQWLVPLQVFDNTNFIFGDYSRSAIRQAQGSSRPQTLQIGVSTVDISGVENDSNHALVLCNYGHLGNAARMPSTLYNDPSFLVYSADIAQANDFARLTHDQTDGLLESGNGRMRIKGASRVRIEGSAGGFDLPAGDGTNGQVPTTDGAGNVSWQTPSGGGGGISIDEAKRVSYIGI